MPHVCGDAHPHQAEIGATSSMVLSSTSTEGRELFVTIPRMYVPAGLRSTVTDLYVRQGVLQSIMDHAG